MVGFVGIFCGFMVGWMLGLALCFIYVLRVDWIGWSTLAGFVFFWVSLMIRIKLWERPL